jgi:hypothetical protein
MWMIKGGQLGFGIFPSKTSLMKIFSNFGFVYGAYLCNHSSRGKMGVSTRLVLAEVGRLLSFDPVINLGRNRRPFGSLTVCVSPRSIDIIALILNSQHLITCLDELMILIHQGRLSILRVGYYS